LVNIIEKYRFILDNVKIGFNWFTFNFVIAITLTVFTEILFLNYFIFRQGYIVAYCYLLWALVAWYYLMHKRIKTAIEGVSENNR